MSGTGFYIPDAFLITQLTVVEALKHKMQSDMADFANSVENCTGTEANVVGFPWGSKDMLQDSRWDGKSLYGIPAKL